MNTNNALPTIKTPKSTFKLDHNYNFEVSKTRHMLSQSSSLPNVRKDGRKRFINENINSTPNRVMAALDVKFPKIINKEPIPNPSEEICDFTKESKYLDILSKNTNDDIDMIEAKYLKQMAENYSVQAGLFDHPVIQHYLPILMEKYKHFDEKFVIKLIEDILLFINLASEKVEGLSRMDCIIRSAYIFLKLRFNDSLYHIVKDQAVPYITEIFGDYFVQSSDFIGSARELLNAYKNINNSPIVLKLYKCAMYMMSLSIFDKIGVSMDNFGYSKLEQAAIKKQFYKRKDFIYVLFDTLLFIAERGYQVYLTGDPMTIFHSGGTYKEIFDLCRKLQRQRLLLTNPEIHGFTDSEFRSDLDKCIEKLESISKHSYNLDKNDIIMIKTMLDDMLMLRDDVTTKASARCNRKSPFGVLISGDSGIGKTTITSILSIIFARHKNLPLGPEFRYTRNPAAKFWDGFVSSCHTLILDDVANEAAEMQDPKSVNEIIQIMNNAAFCPDQASLENKGKTPLKAKLVIATTNVKHLNAYYYFSCPSAVQRRFPYIIIPRVRDEYKDERGMLNSSMIQNLEPYPDLWLFDIDLVRPVTVDKGKRWAEFERIESNLNLKQLLKWYISAINKFDIDQEKVSKSLQTMEKISLCMCCSLPETMCDNAIQSEFVQASILTMVIYLFFKSSYMDYINYLYNFFCAYNATKTRLRQIKRDYIDKLQTRENWEKMGNKMYHTMAHPASLATLATLLTSGYMIYKIYTKLVPQTSVSEDVGSKPKPEENGRENVWYNNTPDLSVANFTRESSSSKSMEFTQFLKKISINVAHIEIDKSSTNAFLRSRMICLGGHIWITNNHNVPIIKDSVKIKVILDSKLSLSSNFEFELCNNDVHRVPDKDLVFLTLRSLPPMKKILKYFQVGKSNGIFDGCYVGKTGLGEPTYKSLKKVYLHPEKHYKFPDYNISASVSMWASYCPDLTVAGDCGTPLVINSQYGYSIVGIHFLAKNSSPTEAFAISLDGTFLEEEYNKLASYNIEAGDFTMISAPSAERKVTELHKKSVFRYIPEGCVDVYGSFTDFRGKSKSSVEPTPMSTFLKDEDYAIKFGKPDMLTWKPWRIAALDLVKPIATLRTDILDKCVSGYINDVLGSMVTNNVKDMLFPLDNFTAINGAPVAYIDKLNRNTSAGNPWKKSKRFFMKSIPPAHDMPDPVEVTQEILDRIDEIITTYHEGKRVHPNFCAHLKDEPTSFAKMDMGKTRVFTGAPMDWSIVVRKYLLPFSRLQQNERFAFEAAPGTIAQSLEWDEMYHHITKFGTSQIIAGDYKAFDKKMSPKEILAAFDVIIHFCVLSGNYTSEDINVIRGIAEDTAFAVVDYNGDLIQLHGSNPSGHPLTVVVNGIVNSLRVRYGYYLLNPNEEVNTFKSNVSLMTYGDDNIMSVSNHCPWFNHTTLAKSFATLDIIYTMADKEAVSVPYIDIKDASFLKRVWRYDNVLKCRVAPLDHASIEKMLMIWCKSKAVCCEAQGISVITTALREYFYYGEDIYNKKLKLFKELIEKLHWELFVEESTFLSYPELCNEFKKASKRCLSYNKHY